MFRLHVIALQKNTDEPSKQLIVHRGRNYDSPLKKLKLEIKYLYAVAAYAFYALCLSYIYQFACMLLITLRLDIGTFYKAWT